MTAMNNYTNHLGMAVTVSEASQATSLRRDTNNVNVNGNVNENENEQLWENFNEKIKDLKPQEQKAIKDFWRSLVLPSQGNYAESNGHLPQYAANIRNCKCCPYGYHIDLQFVRYCEALSNAKPTTEELQRRTRRRSRMSMEFMLGLESLFDQWDAALDKEQQQQQQQQHQQHPQHQQQQQQKQQRQYDILTEHENERETPDCFLQRSPSFITSTPLRRYQRSSSVPRFNYTRPESPFATNSSTCSSYRGTDTDTTCLSAANDISNHAPINYHFSSINTVTDTNAFLQDALGDVCNDFERTLERASMKRHKSNNNNNQYKAYNSIEQQFSDRNNNHNNGNDHCRLLSINFHDRPNDWYKQLQSPSTMDNLDSCLAGRKSSPAATVTATAITTTATTESSLSLTHPFNVYGKPLPFQQKLSPGERQYESYVKATVAANAKSPIEDLLPASTHPLASGPVPAPPPRRHLMTAKLISSSPKREQTLSIDCADDTLVFTASTTAMATATATAATVTTTMAAATTPADPQALFNIREQMALSLKRMKDLEEQVKIIPDLKNEVIHLREEKQRLQQTVQRKDEELQRSRDLPRFSSSPSPVQSPKYSSPIQFQPQRVSPIALESMGSRLRSPSSSEKSLKPLSVLKRDVGTICLKTTTRDVAVGDNSRIVEKHYRDQGCNTSTNTNTNALPTITTTKTDTLFTKIDVEERIKVSIQEHEEQSKWERFKRMKSIGTQMYIPKKDVRDRDVQTVKEASIQKYNVGVMAQPNRRDAFVTCKPETRSIGSSQDSTIYDSDILCEKCKLQKRPIGTTLASDGEEKTKGVSLKLLDMFSRSNTFSLGDQEKLNIKHKTVGTQCIRAIVQSSGSQTSAAVLHNVATQHKPDMQNSSTQSIVEIINRHTDTNDLICLEMTSTRIDEIAKPITSSDQEQNIVKTPLKCHVGCNTETKDYRDIGVNVESFKSISHTSSNTDTIHKRDVGCGDVVKPHISIACADNYCDSCKDAIKNLAKDFSKSGAISPANIKANVDSKIPRPRQLTSPSPVRRTIHRQNTYTVTPPATPSPITDKKRMISSITERSSEILSEKPNLTRDQKSTKSKDSHHQLQRLTYDLSQVGDDDLVVREEKRVSISWSRDNSPAPSKSPLDDEENQSKEITSPVEDLDMELERTQKYIPSKDMITALKIINNSLVKKSGIIPASSATLKSSKAIIQQEWFRITNSEQANPFEIKDYLECFEGISIPLLEYCVNTADGNGNTAMHYAVSHGNFDVISVLLNSKVCNVNQMNNAGYTCVMLVSLAKLKNPKHRTIVERLFQMADVNIKAKKHSQTALMLAVSHGNLEMVKLLIDNGADVNIQDDDGSTALMCAAEHGRGDIVKHLLSHSNCDSLIKDVDGSTAFKIAWQAGHREIGMLLYLHEQMMRSKLPQHTEESATSSVMISPNSNTTNRNQHKRQSPK